MIWLAIVALVLVVSAVILGPITIFRDNNDSSVKECQRDWCVSNIISGAKRCPPAGGTISRQTTAEVCNPRRSCLDALTPHMLYDFQIGTVTNNFCPVDIPDEQCRCMNSTYCPVQYSSYFTNVGNNIITNTSYLNPIVRNVNVASRPYATLLNNGTCTITTPEKLWPPEFNNENKCLEGRLIKLNGVNQFACMQSPELTEIVCPAPRRIVQAEDGSFSCRGL